MPTQLEHGLTRAPLFLRWHEAFTLAGSPHLIQSVRNDFGHHYPSVGT